MTVHNKGFKANRDRAILVNSYHVMCKTFNIPRRDRLDSAAIARLSNDMIYKVSKDLYASATVKQAKKLAVKMGLVESDGFMSRLKTWIVSTFVFWKVLYSKSPSLKGAR